ncbi:bifunctional protein-serine/threonine kinase/phosphatase [Exilibacterium tricleocarpae]|uniref:Bifunctional protein-serine/threonine kinase/phosphatase n=2 Tax=Exilibacterium tricleocarpae TaxID=2591008 RepID=A0A545U5T3_9GAMM|nr:bifunctional protein-serine/threonine kinase/phosphatase [Exilibacterium tricleocarpae]
MVPTGTAAQSQRRLDVEFGGYTAAGRKAENQDAFAAHQPAAGARQLKGVVACIADGVSSSDNAQLASQTSVTHFIEDYYSTPDTWPVKTAAARVLAALNAWLYHHGRQQTLPHNSLVTTFSAAIVKSNTAHLLHVGDSRIYRLRGSTLELLTRDHTRAEDAGCLIRALGMDTHLEVDYHGEEVQSGDILILTSDGVHGVLPLKALGDLLRAGLGDPDANLEALATRVVERALARGSDDNLSCLLVRVNQVPLEDIDEVHRKLTQLAIPPALEEGMKLDGYEVLRVLHNGTRSHVYLVRDPAGDDLKVLKAPSPNFADDPQYLESFIRERWVGQRIDHRGVMKMYAPPASPFLYHLCEYIEGQTLRQWMFDHPQPSLTEVRDVTRGVITALRVFQRMGMVHRDLKPENIMVTATGQIKLIDFGTVQVGGLEEIAAPLHEQYPVGSVDYIAPEYLLGQRGTHQSDIFSLGVVVYEMLTGRVPFAMSNVHRRPPVRFDQWHYRSARLVCPALPVWVDLALRRATRPQPARRYQALSEFLQDLCTPNRAALERSESAPLLERNPTRFWQLVTALLFILVVGQWLWMSR